MLERLANLNIIQANKNFPRSGERKVSFENRLENPGRDNIN